MVAGPAFRAAARLRLQTAALRLAQAGWPVVLSGWLALGDASAADAMFNIRIDVPGNPAVDIATPSGNRALDYFKESEVARVVSGYSGTEPLAIHVSYPGIEIHYLFATANSSALTVKIPALGINKTFTGTTRNDSRHLALDYLKSKGYLPQMMQLVTAHTVAHTASDPVAGNPQSLLSSMVQNDFDQQFLWRIGPPATAGHEAGAGFRYGSTQGNGEASRSRFLTPFYRYRFKQAPGSELSLSLPLAMTEVDGAESYQAGAALSYRSPILDHWSIAGGASYALTSSSDLIRLAQYGGISLTSDLHWDAAGWHWAMGNMVGYYRTFKLADYDPELRNTAYRNGLVASRPVSLLGTDADIDYFLIDTRYSGSSLYTRAYQEAGVALRKSGTGWNWRAAASVVASDSATGGFISLMCSF